MVEHRCCSCVAPFLTCRYQELLQALKYRAPSPAALLARLLSLRQEKHPQTHATWEPEHHPMLTRDLLRDGDIPTSEWLCKRAFWPGCRTRLLLLQNEHEPHPGQTLRDRPRSLRELHNLASLPQPLRSVYTHSAARSMVRAEWNVRKVYTNGKLGLIRGSVRTTAPCDGCRQGHAG